MPNSHTRRTAGGGGKKLPQAYLRKYSYNTYKKTHSYSIFEVMPFNGAKADFLVPATWPNIGTQYGDGRSVSIINIPV